MNNDSYLIQVAKTLLTKCTDLIENHEVPTTGPTYEQMAQDICYQFKNYPELKVEIDRYTKLADGFTDGVFSATLDSWDATKQ